MAHRALGVSSRGTREPVLLDWLRALRYLQRDARECRRCSSGPRNSRRSCHRNDQSTHRRGKSRQRSGRPAQRLRSCCVCGGGERHGQMDGGQDARRQPSGYDMYEYPLTSLLRPSDNVCVSLIRRWCRISQATHQAQPERRHRT